MEYADAQFDDARLAMMLVRSAVDHGAVAANYTAVTDYLRGDDGRVHGVRVREETSGEEFDVHARAVILAGACGPRSSRSWPRPTAASRCSPPRAPT